MILRLLIILSLGLSLQTSVFANPKTCIDWPKVFARENIRKIPSSYRLINVASFRDDTEVAGDEWLSEGLAYLLSRYLNTSSGVSVVTEKEITLLPPERPVSLKVGGLFQHIKGWLRIFVQLKDSKGNLIAQFPIETPYPLHQQFFSGLRQVAQKILERVGAEGINVAAMQAIENETANIRAFENFIKGKLAFESYDPNKMEVALIWFQEARREDPKYLQTYKGFSDVYGFLALFHKQNSEPINVYLEGMANTLKEMQKWSRKKSPPSLSFGERFLNAHVHFVTGSRALLKEDLAKAIAELEEAARLVPEDPITAYHLAASYGKMGSNILAGKNRNHAEEINPCLKGE